MASMKRSAMIFLLTKKEIRLFQCILLIVLKKHYLLTERGYFYLIPQWDKIELNQMNGNNLMQVPRLE